MAWTTPGTAIVAGLITAAFWNTSWTENLRSLDLTAIEADQLLIGVSPGVVTYGFVPARTGLTIRFPDTGTIPASYLECDGSLVSRTTYADLFAIIGTTFGAGDGSTTFELPTLTAGTALVWLIKI